MKHRIQPLHFLILLALSFAVLISGCGGGGGGSEIAPTPTPDIPSWTFLVYICSDNSLEYYGYRDVKEMEKVGSTGLVNVAVQWDRSGRFDDHVDWTGCRRYHVQKDSSNQSDVVSTLVEDMGDVNMGSPAALADFIKWGVNKYPAKNYAVVLWDHGNGWKDNLTAEENLTKYICLDEGTGDKLSMEDVKGAFSQAQASTGKKVQVAGMDACLMGNLEVAYQLRDHAAYVVFSQEKEDANGWPYDTILADLTATPSMTGAALSKAIVTRYGQYYSSSTDATQSAIETSQLPALATAADSFCEEAIARMSELRAGLILSASKARYMKGGYSDYKDLGDFADYVSQEMTDGEIKSRAQALRNALNACVIAYYSPPSASGYSGATIWIPSSTALNIMSTQYKALDFAANTRWDEFLASLLTP